MIVHTALLSVLCLFCFLGTEDLIPKEELYNTSAGYILLCSTILVFLSSFFCFWYILLHLKLNKFLKTLLYLMSIFGMIASLIMIIAVVIILVRKELNFITCSMIHYSGALAVFLDASMTAMISTLRYVVSYHYILNLCYDIE